MPLGDVAAGFGPLRGFFQLSVALGQQVAGCVIWGWHEHNGVRCACECVLSAHKTTCAGPASGWWQAGTWAPSVTITDCCLTLSSLWVLTTRHRATSSACTNDIGPIADLCVATGDGQAKPCTQGCGGGEDSTKHANNAAASLLKPLVPAVLAVFVVAISY
jgi:hypothetical protein